MVTIAIDIKLPTFAMLAVFFVQAMIASARASFATCAGLWFRVMRLVAVRSKSRFCMFPLADLDDAREEIAILELECRQMKAQNAELVLRVRIALVLERVVVTLRFIRVCVCVSTAGSSEQHNGKDQARE